MRSDAAIKKQLALSVAKGRRVELENVLIATGRWNRDSDVGLIQMSGDPLDRYIADRILELTDQIKEIEGFQNEPKGKINEAV